MVGLQDYNFSPVLWLHIILCLLTAFEVFFCVNKICIETCIEIGTKISVNVISMTTF